MSCVVTAPPLLESGGIGRCRSGTERRQATWPARRNDSSANVSRAHSLSDEHNSLREMAWKRSSVRSRPGPPILNILQTLNNLRDLGRHCPMTVRVRSRPVRLAPARAPAHPDFREALVRESATDSGPQAPVTFQQWGKAATSCHSDDRFRRTVHLRIQGRISIGVPVGTASQISSISSSVTAMQPSVQSFRRCDAPNQR